MNIPQGATHYLAGDFYHDRGDGQYLIRLPDGEWGKAMISDSTEQRMWPLSDDLTWLALRRDEWAGGIDRRIQKLGDVNIHGFLFTPAGDTKGYTHNQWLTRRRELGLEGDLSVTPEEDEAWNELERRQEDRRQPIVEPPSKYHRMINGEWVDVYDVLTAFEVTNPADAHAIKKMLLPGLRGVKDGIQDRREAIQSLERAIQIEQELHDSHL